MAVIDLATYKAKVEIDNSGFVKGLNDTDKQTKSKMGGLAKFMKTTVVAGVAAVGAALSATAYKSTKDFIDFENKMNEVFTLLPGITNDAMTDMTKQVKDFSKEFGVLPDQLVPSLYQSISAGVPKDNVFEFLEVANKAAVGGVTQLQTAVDGISSVVNAYGQDVIDAAKASDLMFTAVKLGKTDFTQLSQSLFNVIPTASALGVGFENITAGLAAISAQGTPTSVATTQMRQLLVELSKEGGKTANVFKQLAGKSFKDFIAEGNNVQNALQLLEGYAKSSNIGINDLFGSVEAGNAALGLTGKGTEKFSQALEEMANSAGATDTAFGTMEKGLGRSLAKLNSNFKVVLLDLGEKLAPLISDLADWILQNMPTIQSVIERSFNVVGKVVGEVSSIIGQVIDTFKLLFTSTSEGATGFQETFGSTVTWLSEVFADIKEIIGLALDVIVAYWQKYGDDIVAIIKPIFEVVKTVISTALDVVKGIFKVFASLLRGDWQGVWDAVKNILVSVWDGIKKIIPKLLEGVVNIFKFSFRTFIDLGKNLFGAIWDGMKAIWNGLSKWVGNTVNWLKDKLFFWKKSKKEMEEDEPSQKPTNQPFNSVLDGLPSYAVGTPLVKNNGLAYIHKNEAIVPAYANPWNPQNQNKGMDTRGEITLNIDNLINIEGNVDKAVIPNIEQIANKVVDKINKQLMPSITRR